jgi:lipid II:glycine glycyltransferase (peptidoglycan interpeptide bridge formation enzyme)
MEDLLNYYEIYLDTMRRLRGVPFSFSFFKSLWNVLKPKKLLNLFLAEHEGRIIAGQIVLLYKRKIQIFNNASLRKYWRLKPNNLIDYWTIKYGYEQGFNVVDFGGTPPPPSGHYEYKKSIGGKPVPIFSYRKLFSPTKVKLWELTYRFLLKHFHYLLKT